MCPQALHLGAQSVAQIVERREGGVCQSFPQVPEQLLRRVQLRAIRRQGERYDPRRPDALLPAMAPRSVQDHPDPSLRPFRADRREEEIQTGCVHMGQQQAPAFSRRRRDRDLDPDPFIPIIDDPRRPMPAGAPAAPEPELEAEPSLVEGHDPLNPLLGQRVAEVCEKAAWAAASALAWRRRPVFHFTLRCLNW
jgi:hypothetical protein